MLELSYIKPSLGDRIYRGTSFIILAVTMVLIMYPLLFVVNASFSNPKYVYDNPFLIFPKGFNLDSYKLVFENSDVWIGYKNSFIYMILGTLINIIMTVCGAYPLSRKDFVGRNALTLFYTFTMFFSGGLIPFFLICRQLGLYDNLWVMILPGAVSVYNMIIMRTYFQSRIPHDLEESAMIDGCTNFKLLLKIVLPLAAPIMAVMVLFYGVGHWNSYFHAMIFINKKELWPLQLVLREILIKNEMSKMLQIVVDEQYAERMLAQMGLKYVIVIVATLPIFIIYPLMQRFFKEGIMVGALKG